MTIKCTTVGVEPSKMCYEICVLAHKCGALKAWEREKQKRKGGEDDGKRNIIHNGPGNGRL